MTILFTGSVGSGKTSAIRTISEIPVVSTEAKATDHVAQQKSTTTVAFDYGEFTVDDGHKVKLFGTPGQDRFSYMWDILQKNALGLIVLINNKADAPLEDLQGYLDYFHDFIEDTTAVVGVTHIDEDEGLAMNQYYQFFADHNLSFPLFPIDARNEDNVKVLIESMVAMLMAV